MTSRHYQAGVDHRSSYTPRRPVGHTRGPDKRLGYDLWELGCRWATLVLCSRRRTPGPVRPRGTATVPRSGPTSPTSSKRSTFAPTIGAALAGDHDEPSDPRHRSLGRVGSDVGDRCDGEFPGTTQLSPDPAPASAATVDSRPRPTCGSSSPIVAGRCAANL